MADLTGERLGPFEIEALLGVGGFATVYRAHDPRLRGDVAIKILAENHALNPDVRSRFLSEALALRRIDSPSVIDIHDVRETPDGQPFLVLEYADRGDLLQRRRDRIGEGWQPKHGDVRCLIEALSEALDAMHTEQLIHRDVTPSNLLIRSSRRTTAEVGVAIVESDERILLSDMGLAKDLADGSGLTLGGGTAGFAAPEQGQPLAKIDHRTDVYAASAVVLWFLTGEVVSVQPTWTEVLRADGWPPALIDGLWQGLAEDPDNRPPSILEWRRLLIAALSEPVDRPRLMHVVDGMDGIDRIDETNRSRRRPYVISSIVAAALMVIGIGALVRAGNGTDAEPTLDSVQAEISTDQADVLNVQADASTDQADASNDQAETATEQVVASTELVFGYDETSADPDRQRPELYEPVLDPVYGTVVTRINSADPNQLAVDSYTRRQIENVDGTRLLTFQGEDNGFRVNDRNDGTLIRDLALVPESAPQWHPTDPDRVRYLVLGELKLHEVDVISGESSVLADLTDRVLGSFPTANSIYPRLGGAPSADGSRYAWYVFSDGVEQPIGAITYDLPTDSILGTLPASEFPDAGRSVSIAMSATGDYAVSVWGEGAYVYDADMTNERLIYPGSGESDLALNEDGGDSYVYVNFGADEDGGWLVSADLETLTRTRIFNLFRDANTLMEVSGRGFDKPGWVVASSHDCKLDAAWSCDKVLAVELQPDGRVVNLAHTYSCTTASWYQPQAVPNRDFSRVYFTSDNGACDTDAELMVIDVPPFD